VGKILLFSLNFSNSLNGFFPLLSMKVFFKEESLNKSTISTGENYIVFCDGFKRKGIIRKLLFGDKAVTCATLHLDNEKQK
jgi:hypothetical protein